LWASGRIDFPFYPPPGFLILLAGAIFVTLAVAVGAGRGSVSGIVRHRRVRGQRRAAQPDWPVRNTVAIGTWIQMTGVLTALIAGVTATRANHHKQAEARH
jgi:hypothetical protein